MKIASLLDEIEYTSNKPSIKVLMETDNTKEIRILMKKGQLMKEHQTPFPIVVEIFEGCINFGVKGQKLNLEKGDIISLEGGVPHDLECTSDAIIRLSLSKKDKVERVKNVAN